MEERKLWNVSSAYRRTGETNIELITQPDDQLGNDELIFDLRSQLCGSGAWWFVSGVLVEAVITRA